MTTNNLQSPYKITLMYYRGHTLDNWYSYLFQEYYRYFKEETGFPSNEEYLVFRGQFEKFLQSYEKKIKTLKLRKNILSEIRNNGFEPFEEFELFKSQLER